MEARETLDRSRSRPRRDATLDVRTRPSVPPPVVWRTARGALGFVPALVVAVVAAAVMYDHDVSLRSLAVFGAYVAVAVTLPGTLVWRALRGGPGHLAEDLAAGTALGYAIEIFGYLVARWVGAPPLFLLVPAGVLAAFLTVPSLRRHWRGSGDRAPSWWSWTVAGTLCLLLVQAGPLFFRFSALRWPDARSLHVDMPFHLALVGELRHHVPPAVPWVAGEPLHYHWFVYAEMAATSWATGIEPQVLLLRLSILPMALAFTTLIAVLGRRLTGRWWPGAAALACSVVLLVTDPGGRLPIRVMSASAFGSITWLSPTQTLGALLFAALALVLVDLLRGGAVDQGGRGGSSTRGGWVLLGVLLAVSVGSKASYLPLLAAGLTAVAGTELARRRRVRARTLACLAATLAGIALMRLVLMPGTSGTLTFRPLATMRLTAGKAVPEPDHLPLLLAVALVSVLAWSYAWAGVLGLRSRAEWPEGHGELNRWAGRAGSTEKTGRARWAGRADPAVPLLLGIGAAALGAALFLGQAGGSQLYFFIGARPYLALAAVYGLARALPDRPGRPAAAVAAMLGACGIGAAAAMVVRAVNGDPVLGERPEPADAVRQVLLPHLMLLGAAAGAVAVVVWAVRWPPRLWRPRPAMALPLGLAVLTGVTLPGSVDLLRSGPAAAAAAAADIPSTQWISPGGIGAARWLRAHSRPGDLVATNAHCRTAPGRSCENRHFWISAFTERRVLVEGWGYTAKANARVRLFENTQASIPFWNPRLLADNDRAFTSPSMVSIGRLRDRYGVRWLFVDRRGSTPAAHRELLSPHAVLRYHRRDCEVYEIAPANLSRHAT